MEGGLWVFGQSSVGLSGQSMSVTVVVSSVKGGLWRTLDKPVFSNVSTGVEKEQGNVQPYTDRRARPADNGRFL